MGPPKNKKGPDNPRAHGSTSQPGSGLLNTGSEENKKAEDREKFLAWCRKSVKKACPHNNVAESCVRCKKEIEKENNETFYSPQSIPREKSVRKSLPFSHFEESGKAVFKDNELENNDILIPTSSNISGTDPQPIRQSKVMEWITVVSKRKRDGNPDSPVKTPFKKSAVSTEDIAGSSRNFNVLNVEKYSKTPQPLLCQQWEIQSSSRKIM